MKTLKKSFFWAIFIALVAAFSACDLIPNVVDPDPDPDPEPIARDSVVIEVTLNVPTGAVISETYLLLRDSVIPNGFADQTYQSDVRTFRFVFYDEVARAMIGTQCEIITICGGFVNGEGHTFLSTNLILTNTNVQATIQKVTKVTIDVE